MSKEKWFKGNIHTHTNESDGDSSPERVVSLYKRHEYDFLVLSDHNHLTVLKHGHDDRHTNSPLMIPGEEVTVALNKGKTAVHINGIGITRVVEPIDATTIISTLQANINTILEAGGIASLNHPNYTWAFDHEAINQITGASLLEIFNGHPKSNNYGTPNKPSCEEIWDGVLSSGKVIFGVATDDAHEFDDFGHNLSNPGRGWLMVKADHLSTESVLEALASGNFYASTGVTLENINLSRNHISITIKQEDQHSIFTTQFIGINGYVYDETTGPNIDYYPRGNEGYIRAVIKSSTGYKAWTQPVFLI